MAAELYQFGVNAIGGQDHTLQLFLDRRDTVALIMELVKQLESQDSSIVIELIGLMHVEKE